MSRDEGNAVVEFVAIVVALMLPLSFAIMAFTQYQSAAFGIDGAAQMAARAYVQSSSQSLATYAAARSAAIAGRNHGLLISANDVVVSCENAPCLVPGTQVQLLVRATAQIGAGPFRRTISLRSVKSFVVDPYRQVPL